MRTILLRCKLLARAVTVSWLVLAVVAGCKRDEPSASQSAADGDSGDANSDDWAKSQPDVVGKLTDVDAEVGVDSTDAGGSTDLGIDASAVASSEPLCVKDTLPESGQLCANLGEIRCTNAGAMLSKGGLKFCFRPHSVVCVAGSDGLAVWQLAPCASVVPDSKNCREPSCMIWGSDHLCQPTLLDPQGAKVKYGVQYYEEIAMSTTRTCPNDVGWQHCAGPAVEKCTTLSDLKDLAAPTEAAYGECGKYLKKGSYILYAEICAGELTCPPKTGPSADGSGTSAYFKTTCTIDPATKQPVCQKTCKDVGAPGY